LEEDERFSVELIIRYSRYDNDVKALFGKWGKKKSLRRGVLRDE